MRRHRIRGAVLLLCMGLPGAAARAADSKAVPQDAADVIRAVLEAAVGARADVGLALRAAERADILTADRAAKLLRGQRGGGRERRVGILHPGESGAVQVEVVQ